MSDVIDVQAREKSSGTATEAEAAGQGDVRAEQLKTVGWVSYLLHLIVAVAAVLPGTEVGIGLLVVAFVIDLVKRDDAKGSWQESHFSWRIRSVVWMAALYIGTMPLFLLLYLPGKLAWVIISIWFLYRIVRGMVCMNDNRPVGV